MMANPEFSSTVSNLFQDEDIQNGAGAGRH